LGEHFSNSVLRFHDNILLDLVQAHKPVKIPDEFLDDPQVFLGSCPGMNTSSIPDQNNVSR